MGATTETVCCVVVTGTQETEMCGVETEIAARGYGFAARWRRDCSVICGTHTEMETDIKPRWIPISKRASVGRRLPLPGS